MARVLIVGCGCRGQALARSLGEAGHAVRGTTRRPERHAAIEAAGAEPVTADPDRLATLTPAIEGVTVVCWLMGTAAGGSAPALHGDRLESMLEHIVDTPVRGFVYETGGVYRQAVALVERAGKTFAMPVEIVTERPADHEEWLAAATEAVGRILS